MSKDSQIKIEESSSLWKDAWMRLKKNRMAIISLCILTVIFFCCFILPLIPFANVKDPNVGDLEKTFLPFSGDHLFGTDDQGRDLYARVLYGGQISILVGLVATIVSVIIGVIYGAISGYKGGKVDSLMMRIVDILYGLPFLVLVILFSLLVGSYMKDFGNFLIEQWGFNREFVKRYISVIPLFIAIGSLGWLTMARMARAQVMSLKKQEFIEAARSLGLSHFRILFKHILPNTLGPIIVYSTLTIPGFIMFEATLSFLGLGISSPNASWGSLVNQGGNYMETHLSLLVIPSIAFIITLLCLNFLGDGLRDALDPKASKD